jgi:RNA polymerase sigma-70 factor (ECF subfamily)
LNEAKRGYRTRELLSDETCFSRFITTDFTQEADFKIDLGTSLNKLDLIDREILTLRYIADYSFRDIAKLLNLNESTIKTRMYRCLGKIKNDLENWHISAPFNPKQYMIMVNMLETGKSDPSFQQVTDDFMAVLRQNFRRITSALDFTPTAKITFEIYPNQESLRTELGFNSKFAIGSFRELNLVRMVSPLNPGPHHDYHYLVRQSVALYTVSLTKQLNSLMPRILLYGIGHYIGQPLSRKRVRNRLSSIYRHRELPSFDYLKNTSGPQFAHAQGNDLSYTFIDFIVTRYSWDAFHRLIRDYGQLETIFQCTPSQFEADWKQFVREQYMDQEGDGQGASTSVQHLTILLPDYNSGSIKYRIFKFIECAQAFESANSGVKVRIETMPIQDFFRPKLSERISGPHAVDLVFGPYNSGLSRQGLFSDLLPFYEEDGNTLDDLYKPLTDMTTENGKLTAVPMSPGPLVVFYNKEWFDKANLPEPTGDWTWEQFFSVSAQLKEANIAQGKEIFGGAVPIIPDFWESVARSGGGSILSPDNSRVTGYLNSPLVVAAFALLLKTINEQDVVKMVPNGANAILSELSSGNVGMGVGRIGTYPFLTRNPKLNGKIGVAPLPRMANGVRANAVSINVLSIVAASKQQQLAWKFIKEIILNPDHEFQQDWSKQDMLSSRASVHKLKLDDEPGWKVGIEELKHAVKPILYRNPNFIKTKTLGVMKNLTSLNSEAEIQTALRQAAFEIDKQLALAEIDYSNFKEME